MGRCSSEVQIERRISCYLQNDHLETKDKLIVSYTDLKFSYFQKEMQQPNSSKRQMLWKNEGWSSAEEKMMLTKGKKIKCSAFRGDM